MKKITSCIALFFTIICLLNCCKKKCDDSTNPACENYVNPCSLVHPLSADFSIYENDCSAGPGASDTSWHYYPTDTIATSCATFAVNDASVDSVHWSIGARVYTQKSFYLSFNNTTPVPITLTVYKHRNSCYPNDDSVKTLTKTLYFKDTCLAFGTYRGFFDNNTSDTGTISIMKVYTDTSGFMDPYNIAVSGFVPGCSDLYCCANTGLPDGYLETFYLAIYFAEGNQGTCQGAAGSLYYNPNNDSVVADYETSINNTAHRFRGIRVH